MSASKTGRVLKISDDQTLRFLKLYEEEEVLWNIQSEKYRNRDARADAAHRVAASLNIEGFGPEEVITKFKNLRSSYCQELKKIAASEKTEASIEDIYVPKVIWFSQMNSFLRPHVSSRSTETNLELPERTVDLENSELEQSLILNELAYEPPSTKQETSDWRTAEELEFANSSTHRGLKTSAGITKKRKILSHTSNKRLKKPKNGSIRTALNKLDKSADRAQKLAGVRQVDSFHQFGKYVASLLRNLPLQKAYLVQQQIINVALNANIENASTNLVLPPTPTIQIIAANYVPSNGSSVNSASDNEAPLSTRS